jgi:hypothetical protein
MIAGPEPNVTSTEAVYQPTFLSFRDETNHYVLLLLALQQGVDLRY